jgi:daunorubicin resistance ABC transporter ATP-binding subunit
MSDAPIIVEHLTKRYGETIAADDVSFTAREGAVLGLLGPNGAGKTTVVRIIATLLRADSGSARVLGTDVATDPQRVRTTIGLAGQYAAVDELLTGTENLVMVGRLYGMNRATARSRAAELLTRFALDDAKDRPAKTYSGGMRRRLDLAASIVAAPPVLMLDEPTTGLDPRSRIGMWDVIEGLVDDGTTVLLTTQYLEEADRLCSDIVVIDHGRVIATGTPSDLKGRLGGSVLEVTVASAAREAAAAALDAVLGAGAAAVTPSPHGGDTLRAHLPTDTTLLARAIESLAPHGVSPDDIAITRPTMDDVFLELTGAAS